MGPRAAASSAGEPTVPTGTHPLDKHPLDNPTWAALTGAHARFAQRRGRAGRYDPDVSVFAALADQTDPQSWADLAELVGPGAAVPLSAIDVPLPEGWETTWSADALQMVAPTAGGEADPECRPLQVDDVPEMLDLVARTEPGPFRPRTIELGTYLGIRRDGALAAMAGERLRLDGWTEISAVCTDPAQRGQGLARRLVATVAAGIRARGETPFLHVAAGNATAIGVYRSLGFVIRRPLTFQLVRAPGPRGAAAPVGGIGA